jgi:hypothetical protein
MTAGAWTAVVGIFATLVIDVTLYSLAKYPERGGWIGRIPFIGGALALWKFGRRDRKER